MNKLKKVIKYLKVRAHEFNVSLKELKRSSKLNKHAKEAFFENSMLVEAHSVEKGLGLKNTEPGHSAREVNNLLNKLFLCVNQNKNNTFAFKETFRVIEAYVEYQRKFDTSKFKEFAEIERKYEKLCNKLGNEIIEEINNNYKAGVQIFSSDELMNGKKFDLNKFLSSRHSIRMFEDKNIDLETMNRAVEIANMAPSACNRQPNSVYFCNTKEVVNNVDKIITGSSGFKGQTPNYIVLTTDRARFFGEEQFQWYINGGIYLSFLILALHSLGIGACIMQWKAFHKNEKELKKICKISESEAIIAIIGCGYYTNETKCICAKRKEVNETLKQVK